MKVVRICFSESGFADKRILCEHTSASIILT